MKGYKPGTRVDEEAGKNAVGPSWWMSDDPELWHQKQAEFKKRGGSDCKNLIGWEGVGTSRRAGQSFAAMGMR